VAQSSGGTSDESRDEDSTGRALSTDTLWDDVRIDPIEIALPSGAGYTLRAYRPKSELAAPELDQDARLARDDFAAAHASVVARRRRAGAVGDGDLDDADLDDSELDDELDDEEDAGDEFADESDSDDLDEDEEDDAEEDAEDEDETDEDADEGAAADSDEEVPVFLGARGKVYLFHSPEKLVEFVQSDAPHDLNQLDSWSELAGRIQAADVEPLDEDRYELDLVVENLRGGPDAWVPAIVVKAGEVARDLAYALRLDPVMSALSPGSPLDDLDNGLRAAEAGGIGAFFAKRKLRKTGGQGAALAWRTIIGKISAAVDWRD
jgi:hypothetical protein